MDRRKSGAGGIKVFLVLLAVLALAAGILLGVFRIRELKVSAIGESRHSTAEIEEDLIYDYLTRNTLYFAWKYRNATQEERAPYLQSVRAKIESPSTVQLIIQEKTLIGVTIYNGQYVYFDNEGTVLEITDKKYEGIPVVTGITMNAPELYQKLPVNSAALRSAVLKIAGLLLDSPLEPEEISFDENMNITASFGNVKVLLGQNDYLEEKVANLDTIYQKISSQSGTLNMTAFTGKNENITFRQDDGTTQTATDAGQQTQTEAGEQQTETEQVDNSKGPSSDIVFMAFDSNGILHYDAQVVEGQIVDAGGNPISGCFLNEEGNAVDAFWNVQVLNLPMNQPAAASSAEDTAAAGTDQSDTASSGGTDGQTTEQTETNAEASDGKVEGESTGLSAFAVFDSSGMMRYDAHVVNGQVVDANGYPIDGCYVNENGNVVDAYWNEIDPYTGQAINLG